MGPSLAIRSMSMRKGNNILGDAANEPSIAVDPTDGNKMTIGWRQFNSVQSDFRQGGWGFTTDAGVTWTFPGVLENNVFRSDPVLDSDDTGNFSYLSLRETFYDDIWRSINGGSSWTRLTLGDVSGGDKQWFTIDRTNGTGHGFQYQLWSTSGNNWGGRQFSRSTDDGATWMSPIFLPNSPVWGTLDVDSSGNLFVGGAANFASPFWCLRSTNAQNPAVTPTFDQSTQVSLGGSLDFGDTINPGGLAGQVFLAVDRSGTNNNVYMVASVQPTGFNTGTDVMFVRSTDSGLTFSAPHRINDDPINHNKWHWFGTLAVAPNGRIDSVWLDSRNAANNTDSQLFYSFSTDGGVTWAPNVAVSAPFTPFEGYPVQNKIGDYITIVSDNTGGDVAYTATFNLNPSSGQHEEDVYFVRVTPTGGPTPTPTATATATLQLQLQLRRLLRRPRQPQPQLRQLLRRALLLPLPQGRRQRRDQRRRPNRVLRRAPGRDGYRWSDVIGDRRSVAAGIDDPARRQRLQLQLQGRTNVACPPQRKTTSEFSKCISRGNPPLFTHCMREYRPQD